LKAVLEYPAKYGEQFVWDVAKWGVGLLNARLCEVLLFYPFLFHFSLSFILSSLIVEGLQTLLNRAKSTPKGQRIREE